MDGGAWWATVHGVATSRSWLSDFTFTFHFYAMEKEMATHSSVLAWRIPGTAAWWAAVYGVAQSRTRLKRLSSSSSEYNCFWTIGPGISLEGMMLKLKLQYFGHLTWRVDSLEKTLMLGGIGGQEEKGKTRGWDGWMASLTWWTWVWVNSGSWWLTGRPGVLRFMGSQRVGHDWETELNWTGLELLLQN